MTNKTKGAISTISDYISFFGILMVAFFIPISIAATNIGLCLSIVFYLIKKAANKDFHLIKTDVTVFIPLFFIVSLFSVFHSVDIKVSAFGALKMIKYLSIFIIASEQINNRKRLKVIIRGFILGALLVSFDGTIQFFSGRDFIRGHNIELGNPLDGRGGLFKRIQASFHNSQDIATYLAVIVPLLISLLRYAAYSAKKKIFIFITLALSGFCLIFTYSRGAAITMIVVSVFYTILKKDKVILPVFLILASTAPFILAKSPLLWATSRPSFISLFHDSSRLQHWQAAINMIKAHPFFGTGLNTFCANYDKYKSANDLFSGWYAHQAYLHLAAEIGIVGLILFLGIVFNAIKSFWKSYNQIESSELKSISLGIFSGLLGFLICGLLESNLQYSNLAVLFWLVLTLNMCMRNIIAVRNNC